MGHGHVFYVIELDTIITCEAKVERFSIDFLGDRISCHLRHDWSTDTEIISSAEDLSNYSMIFLGQL